MVLFSVIQGAILMVSFLGGMVLMKAAEPKNVKLIRDPQKVR